MLESVIIYIFVFLIVLAMFMEYVNDRKYQAKRDKERQKSTPKKPVEPEPQVEPEEAVEEEPEEIEEVQPVVVKEVIPEPEVIPEEIIEDVQPEVVVEVEPEPEPEVVVEVEPEPEPEVEAEVVVEESKELPTCEYPPFTHVRLVEMGLSDDEATEFVNELIPQLEEQIPLIEEAINIADFHQIERLTHGIKGSATNLGTGGISDLLVEYNTYLKSGTDSDVVKAYHKHYLHYIEELKKQYT